MPLDHTGEEFNSDAHGEDIMSRLNMKSDFGKNHLGSEEISNAHIEVIRFCTEEVREPFRQIAHDVLKGGNQKHIDNLGIATTLLIRSGDKAGFQQIAHKDPEFYSAGVKDFYETLCAYCMKKGMDITSSYKLPAPGKAAGIKCD